MFFAAYSLLKYRGSNLRKDIKYNGVVLNWRTKYNVLFFKKLRQKIIPKMINIDIEKSNDYEHKSSASLTLTIKTISFNFNC